MIACGSRDHVAREIADRAVVVLGQRRSMSLASRPSASIARSRSSLRPLKRMCRRIVSHVGIIFSSFQMHNLLSMVRYSSGWLGSNQRTPRPKRGMLPLHHTQACPLAGARAGPYHPTPAPNSARATCARASDRRLAEGGRVERPRLALARFQDGGRRQSACPSR